MKKTLLSLFAAILLITVAVPSTFAATKPVVVSVDGKTVTLEEFTKLYKILEHSYIQAYGEDVMQQSINGKTVKQTLQEQLLQDYVNRELIKTYFVKNKITIDKKALEKELKDFMATVIKDADTAKFYKANGINSTFIKTVLTSEYNATKFNNLFVEALKKDTKKLEAAYAKEIVKVNARHILVADEATAKQTLARLQAGEDFATLAKELSIDPGSAVEGGSLGFFKKGVMVPEFEAAAFSTPVGQISQLVKTQFGYHIIKVDENTTLKSLIDMGADAKEIDTYKQEILTRLAKEQADAKLKALAKASKIAKYPDKIK